MKRPAQKTEGAKPRANKKGSPKAPAKGVVGKSATKTGTKTATVTQLRPKSTAPTVDGRQTVVPGTERVERVIGERKLIGIFREDALNLGKVQQINGERGTRLKTAQEADNLNIPAFKHVAKLLRMDELKRKSFLSCVDYYMDICRKHHLLPAEHVGDLFDDKADKEEAPPTQAAAEAEEAPSEDPHDAQLAENLENLKGIKELVGDDAAAQAEGSYKLN